MKRFSSRQIVIVSSIAVLGLASFLAGSANAASNDKRALGKFNGIYKGVWRAAGNLPLTLRMPKGKGNGEGSFEATPCDPGDGVSPLKIRITKYKVRRNGKKLISTGTATWKRAEVPALIGPNLSGKLKVIAVLKGRKSTASGSMATGTFAGSLDLRKNGSLPAAVCVEKAFALPGDPVPIADLATTMVSIVVPNSTAVISDLDVSLSIEHLFNFDLDIKLLHVPSGIEIELFTDVGADDDGFFIRLDDEAPGGVDISDVPDDIDDFPVIGGFTTEDTAGDPMPEAKFLLSEFDGVLPGGEWVLTIEDDSGGLGGTLLNWTLHFGSDVP